MDAITLLRNDHKTVEALFKRFEKAGDNAYVEKRAIVDRIVEELSVHAAIEEQVFYPFTRSTVPVIEDIALESLEEHHIVKWVLSELDSLDPRDERFNAKVTVLIENVRHHVEEEQTDYFPKVRNALGRKELGDLSEALLTAKKSAPTHPHPRSPDTPPGNSVVGNVASVVDRVGDTLSGLAQGGVAAVQDLAARVTRQPKSKSAPTGSKATRSTAAAVRTSVATATDRAVKVSDDVKSGVATTARAARAGGKATVTSATKGVAATRTTARRATSTTAHTAAKAAAATRAGKPATSPRQNKKA